MTKPRALWILSALLVVPLAGCAGGDEPAPSPSDDDDDVPDEGGPTGDLHPDCDAYLQGTEPVPEAAKLDAANPVWRLTTNCGVIRAELFMATTPITAGNIANLTRDGYFDGIRFHRVIDGFMIQGGDPNTKQAETAGNVWGTGGPGHAIRDEFPCKDGTTSYSHPGGYDYPATQCNGHQGLLHTHDAAGFLSMANSGPHSGGSQFFITHTATHSLDGYHPVFGRVIDGLEVVMAIGKVEKTWDFGHREQARPVEPVVIEEATIEA